MRIYFINNKWKYYLKEINDLTGQFSNMGNNKYIFLFLYYQ
jgi:hypothetical protein